LALSKLSITFKLEFSYNMSKNLFRLPEIVVISGVEPDLLP
jgi:hypothetical protein